MTNHNAAALLGRIWLIILCSVFTASTVRCQTAPQRVLAPPPSRAAQPDQRCAAPFPSVASSQWGTHATPIYLTLNDQTQLVGTTTYSENHIFAISDDNAPGYAISLTGAFTTNPKVIRLQSILPNSKNWRELLESSTIIVHPTQQGSSGLSFTLPDTITAGLVAFSVEDPLAPTVYGIANTPNIEWANGNNLSSTAGMPNSTRPCMVDVGGMLFVSGHNLGHVLKLTLSRNGIVSSILPTYSVTDTSLSADIPKDTVPGSYTLSTSDNISDPAYSALPITITRPPDPTTATFYCSGLIAGIEADNTRIIQDCLYNARPHNGVQKSTIILPTGTFVIKDAITVESNEVLSGQSSEETIILGHSTSSNAVYSWILLAPYSSMLNLSVTAPATPYVVSTTSGQINNGESGFIELNNTKITGVDITSTPDARLVMLSGPSIIVRNSTFHSGTNQAFDITLASGVLIENNTFILNGFTGLALQDSQNILFRANEIFSDGNPHNSAGTGLAITRAIDEFGPSEIVQNVFISNNHFHNMGTSGQGLITTDGGGGAYYGPVTAGHLSQLTLADDPSWIWVGNSCPWTNTLLVVAGTGVGQYSPLASISGRNVYLEHPLQVDLDATSIVEIVASHRQLTIEANRFQDTAGIAVVASNTFGLVIDHNILNDSGSGILVGGSGPYGGPAGFGPTVAVLVDGNILEPGTEEFLTIAPGANKAGIGVFDGFGIYDGSTVIRDNVVTDLQTLYSTNGENGINNVVVDRNAGLWVDPQGAIPGFLIIPIASL